MKQTDANTRDLGANRGCKLPNDGERRGLAVGIERHSSQREQRQWSGLRDGSASGGRRKIGQNVRFCFPNSQTHKR